jgi:hypothetical protein
LYPYIPSQAKAPKMSNKSPEFLGFTLCPAIYQASYIRLKRTGELALNTRGTIAPFRVTTQPGNVDHSTNFVLN